ncbi:hypothetical protein [Deminuibacter soli]|uniref:hypothetical protein n=1 Tax=Deminuibacter soli TaxID=2291815 RepID=UPI0011C0DD30|nr:hypothetical protein [Deminuibacter soli]
MQSRSTIANLFTCIALIAKSQSSILFFLSGILLYSSCKKSSAADGSGRSIVSGTHNNSPSLYNNYIYYEQAGIWRVGGNGQNNIRLCTNSYMGYSISPTGKIAYVNFDLHVIDQTQGTIWMMDEDGSNKKQITFNNTF